MGQQSSVGIDPGERRFQSVPYRPLGIAGHVHTPPFLVGLFTRLQRDPGAVRFYQRLRKKYASDYVYVWLLTTRTLVVMDEVGVRHVLAHSPYAYADTKAKHDGMSHFQPGGWLDFPRSGMGPPSRRSTMPYLITPAQSTATLLISLPLSAVRSRRLAALRTSSNAGGILMTSLTNRMPDHLRPPGAETKPRSPICSGS